MLFSIAAWLVVEAPGVILGKPVPASIAGMYVFFSIVMILLVMTCNADGARGLLGPLKTLAVEPGLVWHRNAVIIILPIIAGLAAYSYANKPSKAVERRVIHPPPPAKFRAYGKEFALASIQNPYRAYEKDDPEKFAEIIKAGGGIYFKNCFFCHGAKLDGKGHFAPAMSPRPLPFTGTDTIAQLSESYIFWRVVAGGPGLPKESAPWTSAMPAWENMLAEEEVWQVIAFLYDHTGNRPRSRDKDASR